MLSVLRQGILPSRSLLAARQSILNLNSSSSSLVKSPVPYPVKLGQQPSEPSWKEAASLMILAENQDPFDYDILMVKRSKSSSFMASAFVFPGGATEPADFDASWYSLFEKCGFDKQKVSTVSSRVIGPRPPIITDSVTLRAANLNDPSLPHIHADIGLRISAIRETFEEVGVLLLTDSSKPYKNFASTELQSSLDLSEWQGRVRNNADDFRLLCDSLNMVPDIWSLYEWSNWLTPVNAGHRRFDTLFYVCCLRKQPQVRVDNAEVTKPIWVTPPDILQQFREGKVFLAPPQVYELSRLLHHDKIDQLIDYLEERQVMGNLRLSPFIAAYDDGTLFILPCDDLYPPEPELLDKVPVATFAGSVEEANRNSKFLDRVVVHQGKCYALVNIEPKCGHRYSITYPPLD